MRRVLDLVAIAVVLVVGYYYVFVPLLRLPQTEAAAAVPAAASAAEIAAGRKQDAERRSDMHLLQHALAGYFKDHASYPPTPLGTTCGAGYDNLDALSTQLVPQYLAHIPKDPKPPACPYNYQYTSDGENYAVRVHLFGIDPGKYSDHWCIGAAAGSIPALKAYLPCP